MLSAVRPTSLWLTAYDNPAATLGSDNGFNGLFSPASNWDDVSSDLSGFKIIQNDIYNLSIPQLATLTEEITNLGSGNVPFMLEASPLPENGHVGYGIEGFNGSFGGLFWNLAQAVQYAAQVLQVTVRPLAYVAMDEPLFFGHDSTEIDNLVADDGQFGAAPQWSISQVAQAAALSLNQARVYDPTVQFGDIEPVPYVTSQEVSSWVSAFQQASGTNLAFFQADVVWTSGGWQSSLESISAVLSGQNIPLNIIIDGDGNGLTNVQWTDEGLNNLIAIYQDPNITYSSLNVESWNSSPAYILDQNLSDKTDGTLANLASDAALMNTTESIVEETLGRTASSYELYYYTKMLSTGQLTTTQLTATLTSAQALIADVATQQVHMNACPSVNEQPIAATAAPIGVYAEAVSLGLDLPSTSSFVLPGSAPVDISDMGGAANLGQLTIEGTVLEGQTWDSNYSTPAEAIAFERSVKLPGGMNGQINVLAPSISQTSGALLYGGAVADYIYLASGDNTFILGSPSEIVVDGTGLGNSRIVATSAGDASATVIGDGSEAILEVTAGGTFRLADNTSNVSVQIDCSSSVYLNKNPNVSLESNNQGNNYIWLGAAGQAVTGLVGYNCIYGTAATLTSATTISADGQTQLNIYNGGSVEISQSISGISNVILYRSISDPLYEFYTSGQSNIAITDNSGGDIINLDKSSQSVSNLGSLSLIVKASAIAASADVDGGLAGATMAVTTSGDVTIGVFTSNVTVQLDQSASIHLNANSSVNVDALEGENYVWLGALDQSVTAETGYTCIYATAAELSPMINIIGSGTSQLNVYGGGAVNFGENVVGVDKIQLYRSASDPIYEITANNQIGLIITDNSGGDLISLQNGTQWVRNSGTLGIVVDVAADAANVNITAGTAGAVLDITNAGTAMLGNTSGNLDVNLAYDTSLHLDSNPDVNVLATGTSNLFWLGSAGQSITAESGYSCTYATVSQLVPNTTIDASGFGQINIYSGGTVDLAENIKGISNIQLYRLGSDPTFNVNLEMDGSTTVFDNSGGDTITLSSADKTVDNLGGYSTNIRSTVSYGDSNIIGGQAGATFEITNSGSFELGSLCSNVEVLLDQPASVSLNDAATVSIDATVGDSLVNSMGRGQVIFIGTNDTIDDGSGLGFEAVGSMSAFNEDAFANYNNNDILDIRDLIPGSFIISTATSMGATCVTIENTSTSIEINFLGYVDSGVFQTQSDSHGGSLISHTTSPLG